MLPNYLLNQSYTDSISLSVTKIVKMTKAVRFVVISLRTPPPVGNTFLTFFFLTIS